MTLPQGPVPVSGVFPVGVALAPSGDWDSGNPAFAISRGSPGAPLPTPGHDRRFPGMLFSPFTFRITGQPSDPETSPLVPARYAGDTTLRLVAQLQRSPAAPHPGAGRSLTTTPPPRNNRDPQDRTTRPPRRPRPRVSAGRMTCAAFWHPQPVVLGGGDTEAQSTHRSSRQAPAKRTMEVRGIQVTAQQSDAGNPEDAKLDLLLAEIVAVRKRTDQIQRSFGLNPRSSLNPGPPRR